MAEANRIYTTICCGNALKKHWLAALVQQPAISTSSFLRSLLTPAETALTETHLSITELKAGNTTKIRLVRRPSPHCASVRRCPCWHLLIQKAEPSARRLRFLLLCLSLSDTYIQRINACVLFLRGPYFSTRISPPTITRRI